MVGAEAVAISFLHGRANSAHEERAEVILHELLDINVNIAWGSEILPEVREYERTSTAVVNACIAALRLKTTDILGYLPDQSALPTVWSTHQTLSRTVRDWQRAPHHDRAGLHLE